MTGQLEYDLSKVEKGELTLEKYMAEVEEAIIRIVNELRTYEQKNGKTPLALAPTGKAKDAGTRKTETTAMKDKGKGKRAKLLRLMMIDAVGLLAAPVD